MLNQKGVLSRTHKANYIILLCCPKSDELWYHRRSGADCHHFYVFFARSTWNECVMGRLYLSVHV